MVIISREVLGFFFFNFTTSNLSAMDLDWLYNKYAEYNKKCNISQSHSL